MIRGGISRPNQATISTLGPVKLRADRGGAGRPGRYGAIASAWEDLGGFSLQALAQMAHQEG